MIMNFFADLWHLSGCFHLLFFLSSNLAPKAIVFPFPFSQTSKERPWEQSHSLLFVYEFINDKIYKFENEHLR